MNPNAKLYSGPAYEGPRGQLSSGPFYSGNIQFGHPNLAAAQTDHQMNWGGVAALDALIPFSPAMPGYISWVTSALSEPAVGSDLIIEVYKNGIELVESIHIVPGGSTGYVKYPAKTYLFAAGDKLDLRFTTGALWTSTTADLGAVLGFIYTP